MIANPIYREVIPSALASVAIASLPQIPLTWVDAQGHLDEGRLLEAFLGFWRQHGEPLFAAAPYHEIAPHLVLMAFLHRVQPEESPLPADPGQAQEGVELLHGLLPSLTPERPHALEEEVLERARVLGHGVGDGIVQVCRGLDSGELDGSAHVRGDLLQEGVAEVDRGSFDDVVHGSSLGAALLQRHEPT